MEVEIVLARVVEIVSIVFLGGGKLGVVIEAVFFTILFSGLVSLNGTGFSPCSEPDAAATLCDAMVVLFAHGYFPTLCCAVWAQQLLLPGSLLAVLLAGKVLLLALHSLSHYVVEVVVARPSRLPAGESPR